MHDRDHPRQGSAQASRCHDGIPLISDDVLTLAPCAYPPAGDFLAVGNPTLDIADGGGPQVGGTVVYAALQAARLGMRATVVGRRAPVDDDVIRAACGPGVAFVALPAVTTTIFRNTRLTEPRRQVLCSSAGRIDVPELAARSDRADVPRRPDVLHIAPVARETPVDELIDHIGAGFVGLTPQGLIRAWAADGEVRHVPLEAVPRLAGRIDALVLARDELAFLTPLADAVVRAGNLVVVTRGAAGCEVRSQAGVDHFGAHRIAGPVDDTGAGDVFAAALFVELHWGVSIARAARVAAIAAALSMRGVGVSRVPTGDEIRLAEINYSVPRSARSREEAAGRAG